MDYGEKHSKTWKMRNAHCRTWSMARKFKIKKNEKYTLQDLEYGEETENVETETQTLQDL